MYRIIFVCTGNTCRSPMAHGLLSRIIEEKHPELAEHIIIETAGVDAGEGWPATSNAIQVMHEVGVDLKKHRSRKINKDMIKNAGLVVTMTQRHYQELVNRYPDCRDRIVTLAELAGAEASDISDPIGGDVEVYRKCRDELQEMLEQAWKKIKDRLNIVAEPDAKDTEGIME